MTATAYSESGLGGNVLGSLSVQFSVVPAGSGNQPPTAIATGNPLTGEAPLAVTFTGSGSTDDEGITSYAWDFGDGTTSNLADPPAYTYADPGTYNVTLTVTDSENLSDTANLTVQVNEVTDDPPTAVAQGTPLTGDAPLDVTFTGSNSFDDNAIISYAWDFGDTTTSSLADPPVHTYSNPGTYNVSLTVTDDANQTNTATLVVEVTSPTDDPPTAVASASTLSGNAPLDVTFTGSNSFDDNAIVSYAWDFGDTTTSSLADPPTHTYANPGTYNVSLTVTDDANQSDTANLTITVSDPNQEGVVSFTLVNANTDQDLYNLTEGQQIDVSTIQGIPLNIRANTNPDPAGSVQLNISGALTNTRIENVAPFALYGDAGGDYAGVFFPEGNYTMNATAYSESGLGGTVLGSLSVQFAVVPESTGNQPPTAVAQGTPLNGEAPLSVTFTGSNSFDDSGIVAYAWDFGDGTNSNFADPPAHEYPNPGTYSVSLTVTDAENLSDMATLTVQVSSVNEPPVVTNPGTQNNTEGESVSLQIQASDESTNLNYSASGLPPYLDINSATGLISGTVATSIPAGTFVEQNGFLAIETESGNLVPNWTATTTGGATGIIAGTNSFFTQNGGTIPYQVSITTTGVYRFNWRSFFSGSSPTDENDSWLRFPNNEDVWFFGYQGNPPDEATMIANLMGAQQDIVFPVGSGREGPNTTPNGDTNNNYFKVVRSGGTSEVYSWQALTSDNDGHDIYVYFANPGVYTMEISERSAGHAIDKVALYKVDGPDFTDTQLTNAAEAPISDGQGAASGSPYTVSVTVTDDASPPLSSTEQFTWNINAGNPPPTAVISASPTSGDAPLQVTFDGSGSSDDTGIVSYAWDFGDGNTDSGVAPAPHTYSSPGTYVASLTVTDTDTQQHTASVTITVGSADGVVSFTLVNGDTDADMFDLSDNQQIDQSVVQGINLNIRANTIPGEVGSVSMVLTGPVSNNRTENAAPYALFGDGAGDYFGTPFSNGNYSLSATAYSGASQSGTVLGTLAIQFSINASGAKESSELVNTDETGSEIRELNAIRVYPNPNSGSFTLQLEAGDHITSRIEIYDAAGKQISVIKLDVLDNIEGTYDIELPELESGIYTLRFLTEKADQALFVRVVVAKNMR